VDEFICVDNRLYSQHFDFEEEHAHPARAHSIVLASIRRQLILAQGASVQDRNTFEELLRSQIGDGQGHSIS